jgi:hypothetical protein
MSGEGYGGGPWGGGAWGGELDEEGGGATEHIPTSDVWDAFDLSGVRQPNDMERVRDFIEVTATGQSEQFFEASFNMASGGVYPTTPAILDIDVTVKETFTVEFRLRLADLPPGWGDLENEHILVGVNNALGPCVTFLFSQAGVSYTGAFHFVGNDLVIDHPTLPIAGSDEWLSTTEELVVRYVSDNENGLVYLYITPASQAGSGQVLRALLPPIQDPPTYPPIDRIAVSVRGTVTNGSHLELFYYNKSYKALIPNLPPRAVVAGDQAAHLCSIVQLDGSGSFDPEGAPLVYDWRLIDAPETSQFVFAGADGYTLPELTPTGYTDQFFSSELALQNTAEPIQLGDVIMVGGTAYTVNYVPPGNTIPFYVNVEHRQIPDDLVAASYKLVRQAGLSGADTAKPTFYPDVAGFYLFDLRVFDGSLWSTPDGLGRTTTLVNVLSNPLPRGCTPNVTFLFDFLSDFWQLVEDNEKLTVFWSALAQVASTELFTLWQHEYSKSVRDVQRTFVRRWLHYDTVLGEPIPELTKLHPVWGGVYSNPFTEVRVHTRRLGLSSAVFAEDQVITFTSLDPIDPEQFRTGLERTLRALEDSFRVVLVELTPGTWVLRIDSGFAFTITDATTTSLFTPGGSNGVLSGDGVRVGPGLRTLRVDVSLQGMSLADAFLVVEGTAYVVDRVVSDSADALPYSRVVVREELPASLPDGSDPGNPSVAYRITGWVQSELLDFWNGLVTEGDHVDFEVVDESDAVASTAQEALTVYTVAFGASESFPSRLPVDFGPLSAYLVQPHLAVRLAGLVRRGRLPVDPLVVDIPTLQEKIVLEEDTSTLRRNLDFYIEEFRGGNSLRFASGQGGGPDVFEGERPPKRFWAEYTYLDNNPTIENNFGLAVELRRDQLSELPGNVDYLSAVRGLLYALTNGPTLSNLRIGIQILLGLPFAEEDGTIVEIRRDLLGAKGRLLIRDKANPEIVRSYTFPKVLELDVSPTTGQRYVEGDAVVRFAPLVEGAEVLDYVKDPTWFQGMLNQGVFYEVQKYHSFLVRVDSQAFNLSALLMVRNFILKVKPTYTNPRFVVRLYASDEDGDEISLNDTVTFGGTLKLDDAVCRTRLGASTVYDEPRAAGGGYRNQFDGDDDPSTTPVWPTPEPVQWAFDREFLCPSDVVEFASSLTVGATLKYDAGLIFDAGVVDPYYGVGSGDCSMFSADEVPPGTITTSGHALTLSPSTAPQTGTLRRVRFIAFGSPVVGEEAFELVLRNVTQAVDVVIPFTARNNTEISENVSLAVTLGDTVTVTVRAVGANTSPAWTQFLCSVSTAFSWKFDMGVVDPYYGSPPGYPAGTYRVTRQISP